jgi:hypothetical protein
MSLFPPSKQFECLRPFVALGTTGESEGRVGVFYTQALDPEESDRLTAGRGGWGMSWAFQQLAGDVPRGARGLCGRPSAGRHLVVRVHRRPVSIA